MFEKLPDWVDPVYCAEHHKRFNARVNQRDLKRLVEQVYEAEGDIEVEVVFKRHAKLKTPQFDLTVKTRLILECQLSLESFPLEVESHISGVFVPSMSLAEDLDEDIEIFEWPEGKISLLELVEDEVLLAMPMVPRKQDAILAWQDKPEIAEVKPEQQSKPNPFVVLKSLKE